MVNYLDKFVPTIFGSIDRPESLSNQGLSTLQHSLKLYEEYFQFSKALNIVELINNLFWFTERHFMFKL